MARRAQPTTGTQTLMHGQVFTAPFLLRHRSYGSVTSGNFELKINKRGAPGWIGRLGVRLLIGAQVTIWVVGSRATLSGESA